MDKDKQTLDLFFLCARIQYLDVGGLPVELGADNELLDQLLCRVSMERKLRSVRARRYQNCLVLGGNVVDRSVD